MFRWFELEAHKTDSQQLPLPLGDSQQAQHCDGNSKRLGRLFKVSPFVCAYLPSYSFNRSKADLF